MKKNAYLLLVMLSLFAFACTPKTAKKTAEKPSPTTEKPKSEKPAPQTDAKCPTFKDAPNEDKAIEDYVVLKGDIKAKQYDRAFPLWEKVYRVSPAADGKRNYVFMWGIEIYNHKFKNASSATEKKQYVEKIQQIYNELSECYPKDKGFVIGRKAFDMYYNYPDYATEKEKYNLFKQSIDSEGMKTKPFILNPFTALLVEQYQAKAIGIDEAKKYATLIKKILSNGLKTAKGRTLQDFQTVESYAPFRLAEFETVRGFYDCEYYKSKYKQEFEDNKDDCDVIIDVYSSLKWGNCPETDELVRKIDAAYNSKCVVSQPVVTNPTSPTSPTRGPSCNDLLRGGDYQGAIDCLKELYNKLSDNDKKGKVAYSIAQVYYSKFKKYSTARSWAEKAANHKSSWGKPYLLIGDMYASSGPLCGPGRGWDSQVVIWAAMDMWQRAASDPSTASKARRQINKYSQYLPTTSEGFMRSLKEGSSYKIGCWINRNTKARFKKG